MGRATSSHLNSLGSIQATRLPLGMVNLLGIHVIPPFTISAGTHFTYPQRDGGLSQPLARLSQEWVLNPGPLSGRSAALRTELSRLDWHNKDTSKRTLWSKEATFFFSLGYGGNLEDFIHTVIAILWGLYKRYLNKTLAQILFWKEYSSPVFCKYLKQQMDALVCCDLKDSVSRSINLNWKCRWKGHGTAKPFKYTSVKVNVDAREYLVLCFMHIKVLCG